MEKCDTLRKSVKKACFLSFNGHFIFGIKVAWCFILLKPKEDP